MKYLGWIISLILIAAFYYTYHNQYQPLKKDLKKMAEEIAMWENVLKGEKGMSGGRQHFAVDRFFENDKLTPYAEVEILRRFDAQYKSLEMYIAGPNAMAWATDVLRFLDEQNIKYQGLTCYVVTDSVKRFEYQFIK